MISGLGTEPVNRGTWDILYRDVEAPVQPHQQQWEFQQLLRVYERLNPRTVLEIGSAEGGSLYQFMKHLSPGGLFITVDANWCVEGWQEWAAKFGHTLRSVLGDSTAPDIVDRVKSIISNVDFLLIDASHDYEHVKQDFLNYGSLVGPGGVIVLHDIVNAIPGYGVYKFWSELCQCGYIVQELIVKLGEYGTGVLYVGGYITDLFCSEGV